MTSRWTSRLWLVLLTVAITFPLGLLVGVGIAGHFEVAWIGGGAGAAAALLTAANLAWSVYANNRARGDEQSRHDADLAAEQTRRDEQALKERADAAQRIWDAYEHEIDEAAAVTVRLTGGAGTGADEHFRMTSVWFAVHNGATRPIGRLTAQTEPGTPFASGGDAAPELLAAGQGAKWMQNCEPFVAPPTEASDRPMTSRRPVITFTLGGREWARTGDDRPEHTGGRAAPARPATTHHEVTP